MGASALNVLVPARFIAMMGHFIACVLVFWSKGDNVRGGLPFSFTAEQYDRANASYARRGPGRQAAQLARSPFGPPSDGPAAVAC